MDERLYYKEIVYNMCLGSIEEEKGGQKMKKYVLGNVLRLFSYILKGIDDSVVRSSDNPSYCGLSVNGVVFLNRSISPYSLVLACSTL